MGIETSQRDWMNSTAILKGMTSLARLLCVVLGAVLFSCKTAESPSSNRSQQTAGEIVVSAAISLKDAFREIGDLYTARTGTKINFNFGSSGVLQKQIEGAAPIDVFASAGAKQMDELAAKGLIENDTRRDFVHNALMLITPKDSTLGLSSFDDLAHPRVQRLAVGNPKTVPAGQYTEQLLSGMKLLPQIQSRLVFAEDVRQVLEYVLRGEVDAGIVYISDATFAGDRVKVAARAPENTHAPITYPIAMIKNSRHREAALAFIEQVLSDPGQSMLRKHGFLSIKG